MNTTLLSHFPLQQRGRDPALFYEKFWRTNMIIHATSKEVAYAEHAAPLSIKCAFGGREVYQCGAGRFSVDDHSYLVLNHAHSYSSYIRSESEVESFSIFFQVDFAREVLAALVHPADKLLDDPLATAARLPLLFERLYPHDAVVSPVVFGIRRRIREGAASRAWLEEQFHLLLERLLQSHRNVCREVERLPARRPSTRAELYRRLTRAKDFMDSSFSRQLTLPEIARVACLSTHHFLRLFKQTFGETPHQYLTRRRLSVARELLGQTDQPVIQVCLSVGLENASSFSRSFRSRYGCSPLNFRRAQK